LRLEPTLDEPNTNVRYGEGFLMRARVQGFGVDCLWPALEILPRWKPRGLGGSYGESMVRAVSVDAICGDVDWLVDPARMIFWVVCRR
jgi:hypothetical protein